MPQDPPEVDRRLTELQSQINRLSLSLHLWQERQDRLLEQRLTDWSAVEARTQKDASTRMRELVRCLDQAVFIPAVYDHEPVNVFFFGTVTFKVVDGKPRLRIFANQEEAELKKESDFIGPQPFVGRGSKFEGLHYPNDTVTSELTGMVEMAMKIDATGKLLDLKVVSEYPPLVGFGRAAAEDFRVATFIPAFREGKPVECNITLPVYYEP